MKTKEGYMRMPTPERMAYNSRWLWEQFHPRPNSRMRARELLISIQRTPFNTGNDGHEFLTGIELSIVRGLLRFPEIHVTCIAFPA